MDRGKGGFPWGTKRDSYKNLPAMDILLRSFFVFYTAYFPLLLFVIIKFCPSALVGVTGHKGMLFTL